MELSVATASTDHAVSLTEAKAYLRVTDDSENDTVCRQRDAAQAYCERQISGHRTFTRTVYDGYLPEFPSNDGRIELPVPPLYSSTGLAVTYYNTSNTLTTLSSTVYDVLVLTDAPSYLLPKQDEAWPSARLRPDAVKVRFTAGFGASSSVPAVLKEAVLMKLEHLWDPARFPKPEEVDRTVRDMLGTYDYGAYA